jgi:hypothetical protein
VAGPARAWATISCWCCAAPRTNYRVADDMLALLACPGCGGPLTVGVDTLSCAAEGARFRVAPPGLADLRLPETAAAAEAFAASYRAGRLAEGWRPLSPEVAAPAGPTARLQLVVLPLRCESSAGLGVSRGPGFAPLTIADAGAGFLWSSHRLAHSSTAVAFRHQCRPRFRPRRRAFLSTVLR